MGRLSRILGLFVVVVTLTLLTQVGGVAVLLAVGVGRSGVVRRLSPWRRRTAVVALALAAYGVMTVVLVPPLASSLGRVRLPCATDGDRPVVAATWLTCALNRGYVRPELRDLVFSLGDAVGQAFPGSRITSLEGNFPFLDGFPLLPHLSHRDGRKLDLAFFYRRAADQVPMPHGGASRFGYFVYEPPRPGEPAPCAGRSSALRWDFAWFQPHPPVWELDDQRTAWMVEWLKGRPEVSRLFVEPHLAKRMGVGGGKVRFQGCHAARHDDHLHVEVP